MLSPKLLESSYAKLVSKWICEYFKEFSTAPSKDIKSLYYSKKESVIDNEDADEIAVFLANLSKNWEQATVNNVEFEIKAAKKYLKLRALEVLKEDIEDAIATNDPLKGEQALSNFKRIEDFSGQGVSLLKDSQKVMDAFMSEDEILFKLPGALGEVVGNICRGDFLALLAPMKRGKCASGSTQVLLQSGELMPLSEVVARKEKHIMALNNQKKLVPVEVCEWWHNGIKPVYKITTRTGRETTITANHPLLAFDRGWKSIDDGLSIGDYIAAPRNIPVFGVQSIPEDHVKLIAYLLADGGLTASTPTYTKHDPEMMADIVHIAESLGDTVHYAQGHTIYISKGNHKAGPSNTSALLLHYGIPKGKSIDKNIPPIIFTLNRYLIKLFLQTLFSGDGSIHSGGVEYSTGNEVFIRQVQHLLLRFGIVSRITSSYINGVHYWKLVIRDSEYVLKYLHEIGFIGKKQKRADELHKKFAEQASRSYLDTIPYHFRKSLAIKMKAAPYDPCFDTILNVPGVSWNISRDYLERANIELDDPEVSELLNADILWDRIVSIKYMGKEETFDLSVPALHNFIADDICVHNTWYLWFIAEMGMVFGFKVVFFTLEMTERQIVRRAWRSILGKPKETKTVSIPRFVKDEDSEEEKYSIQTRQKEITGVDPSKIEMQQKQLHRRFRKGAIRIIQIPKSSTVETLKATLDNLNYYENFVPDMLVLDYADLLSPSAKLKSNEYRHVLNDIWSSLRDMAIEKNIAMISASQTEKSTFIKDIGAENAAEDIRKIAHVTCALALNQTKDEAKQGIMRIAQVVAREDAQCFEQAVVLQNLDCGKAYLDSRLRSQVLLKKDIEEENGTDSYKRKPRD